MKYVPLVPSLPFPSPTPFVFQSPAHLLSPCLDFFPLHLPLIPLPSSMTCAFFLLHGSLLSVCPCFSYSWFNTLALSSPILSASTHPFFPRTVWERAALVTGFSLSKAAEDDVLVNISRFIPKPEYLYSWESSYCRGDNWKKERFCLSVNLTNYRSSHCSKHTTFPERTTFLEPRCPCFPPH